MVTTFMYLTIQKGFRQTVQFVSYFGEQLANTLRIIGKHTHIWQTSIRGIFARCSFFTCKLGLQRILIVNSLRIFCEYVANIHLNMLIKYAANILRIFCEYSAIILLKRKNRCCEYVANNNCEYPANKQRLCCE